MSQNVEYYLENALQGVLFWIGYRNSFYRNYKVREIGITDQICCFLNSHKKNGYKIECEYSYKDLLKKTSPAYESLSGCAADIVIVNDLGYVDSVIEVKRYEAGIEKIEEDIEQLYAIKKNYPGVHCYEIVVSSEKFPSEFVDVDNGRVFNFNLKHKKSRIPDLGYDISGLTYKVVRACTLNSHKFCNSKIDDDALESVRNFVEKGKFACLVEIL